MPSNPSLPEEAVEAAEGAAASYVRCPEPDELRRAELQAAAPAIRKQEQERLINDPVRVSLCNACGYVDDPRQSSCAHCGGQTQNFSESLAALAAQQERQRVQEALRAQIELHEVEARTEDPAPCKLELAKAEGLAQFLDTLGDS